ncbi:F-box domain-containing protein [Mycena indigotica]|uniref:F-box domain-containing protein n=1 Tax=Mycena indigotica TaxID=2126181 RepID=A0A8H6VRI3_9AGAR|nr:F-box domain-containing protein [Mycena indigotica]KAF7291134.1 F-box domain-containing protein [Mycena indigotica]
MSRLPHGLPSTGGINDWFVLTSMSTFASKLGTNYCPTDDEFSHIQKLIEEPLKSLHQLDARIFDLQKALNALLAERDTITSFIESHKSLLAPIRRLPVEVLQEIFVARLRGAVDAEYPNHLRQRHSRVHPSPHSDTESCTLRVFPRSITGLSPSPTHPMIVSSVESGQLDLLLEYPPHPVYEPGPSDEIKQVWEGSFFAEDE